MWDLSINHPFYIYFILTFFYFACEVENFQRGDALSRKLSDKFYWVGALAAKVLVFFSTLIDKFYWV